MYNFVITLDREDDDTCEYLISLDDGTPFAVYSFNYYDYAGPTNIEFFNDKHDTETIRLFVKNLFNAWSYLNDCELTKS